MREQGSEVLLRMFQRNTGGIMNFLRAYFLVPFRVLGFFIRIFRTNRAWVARQLAGKHAANSVRGVIFITLLAWFLIWLLAI